MTKPLSQNENYIEENLAKTDRKRFRSLSYFIHSVTFY